MISANRIIQIICSPIAKLISRHLGKKSEKEKRENLERNDRGKHEEEYGQNPTSKTNVGQKRKGVYM